MYILYNMNAVLSQCCDELILIKIYLLPPNPDCYDGVLEPLLDKNQDFEKLVIILQEKVRE